MEPGRPRCRTRRTVDREPKGVKHCIPERQVPRTRSVPGYQELQDTSPRTQVLRCDDKISYMRAGEPVPEGRGCDMIFSSDAKTATRTLRPLDPESPDRRSI